jgi:hypothetical protein
VTLTDGPNAIAATYSEPGKTGGPVNYFSSTGTLLQDVQDFQLSAATAPPVVVTQGFTTSSDPFTAQTMSVSPVSIQGFATCTGSSTTSPSYCTTATAAPLSLLCAVTSASGSGTAPLCKLYQLGTTITASTLAVAASGAEPSLSLVMDATSASAGNYTVAVTATDPTTGLVRVTSFSVSVRAISGQLQIASGATTGNIGNVTFQVPAGVTLTNFSCPFLTGAGISQAGGENPPAAGMACIIGTPTTSASGTTITLPVSVCTNEPFSSSPTAPNVVTSCPTSTTAAVARPVDRRSDLLVAGVFGLPFFGLIGLFGGKRTRRAFYQLLVLFAIGIAALQTMGCGGSFHSSSTTVSGTTPPGVYYLMVEGTGSDHNTYEAVLQVDVTVL